MKARLGVVMALMILSALVMAACGPAATGEIAPAEGTQSGPAAAGELAIGEGAATLEGTQWELVSYVTAANETVEVLPGSVITSLFNRGQVDGRGSCNDYAGSYVLSGEKLALKVGALTTKLCSPEEIMGQEKIFLGNLNNAASYKISANRLEIYDDGGLVLLTYRVLEANALVGTTWGLMIYNNGKGGLASSLAGTDITAVFGADGQVAGSASCNTYTAPYQVDGLKISIGAATSTRMACAEPEGIMEQEAAYLAAMQTAIRYEIEGDELVLWNLEGTKAAVFTAQSAPSSLTVEVLANAEYKTEWTSSGVVRLQEGEYRAPAAPESASEIVISMTEYVATGELKDLATGNTQRGAAVILVSSGGGSGTFYELHAMVLRNGQPYDAAWTQLGDRVQINSLAIEGNEIVVDMVTHGPDNPMCCPTKQVVQAYALQGEELVQTSE